MNAAQEGSDGPFDLFVERVLDAPAHLIWQAWTRPDYLRQWWAPKPWETVECEIDLRPGGAFRTVMRGPNGETASHPGCFLELIENRRLAWTDLLTAGFRPAAKPIIRLTSVLTLQPEGKGTRYRAVAMHGDARQKQKHADMGFYEGWNTVLDQLVALLPTLRA